MGEQTETHADENIGQPTAPLPIGFFPKIWSLAATSALIAAIGSILVAYVQMQSESEKTASAEKIQGEAIQVEQLRVALEVMRVPAIVAQEELRRWACSILEGESKYDLNCEEVIKAGASLTAVKDLSDSTKIGIYWCSDSDGQQPTNMARSIKQNLHASNFGTITIHGTWTHDDEYELDALRDQTTIIYDKGSPEETQVAKIERLINRIESINPIVPLKNVGKTTDWYLSIIVCPGS